MKLLMVGDVFGSFGRDILTHELNKIKKDIKIDILIVNGENITHGKGISLKHYNYLKQLNVDVITTGNHIFALKETLGFIDEKKTLLKPINFNPYTPGQGSVVINKFGKKIRVTSILGRVFMGHFENPYYYYDHILKNEKVDIDIVDFHAEATAEKITFALNYDGVITVLAGTHTHVQTADNRILNKGTAYITDIGMTGSLNSSIGMEYSSVLPMQKENLPSKFEPAKGKGVFSAILIDIDKNTNKAISIERIYNEFTDY